MKIKQFNIIVKYLFGDEHFAIVFLVCVHGIDFRS